jgi:ABC-type sugar transport system ATPase subunit
MAEITLEGVRKVFPDGTEAVRSIDLDIPDGSFMVLVGPSGCGKTTVLRMVAGLEDLTEGTIRIGDTVVNDFPPGDRDVAMVFQNYALYPHMTVYQNMALSLKIHKLKKSEIKRRVHEAAGILHLEDIMEKRPRELPHGRAALEPGREAPGADARGDLEDPAGPRRDDDLRHARPDRGDDAR